MIELPNGAAQPSLSQASFINYPLPFEGQNVSNQFLTSPPYADEMQPNIPIATTAVCDNGGGRSTVYCENGGGPPSTAMNENGGCSCACGCEDGGGPPTTAMNENGGNTNPMEEELEQLTGIDFDGDGDGMSIQQAEHKIEEELEQLTGYDFDGDGDGFNPGGGFGTTAIADNGGIYYGQNGQPYGI